MTKEEAGEEILRGPYEVCICVEAGKIDRIKDPNKNVVNICHICRGFEKLLRSRFAAACLILDLDIAGWTDGIVLTQRTRKAAKVD